MVRAPEPRVAMELTLTVLNGAETGRTFKLRQGARATLGRSSASDFQLVAEGVSRSHCLVENKGERALLTDLESLNGTYVNNQKVVSTHLKSGDRIQVGTVYLGVHVSAASGLGPHVTLSLMQEELGQVVQRAPVGMADLSVFIDPPTSEVDVDGARRLNRALRDLCQLGMSINAERDLAILYQTLVGDLLRTTGAERAAILLHNARNGAIDPVAGAQREGAGDLSVAVSRSVVKEVLTRGVSVMSGDALADPRFRDHVSIQDMGICSVMCVPLRAGDAILGALYVDTSDPRCRFQSFDLDLLTAVGSQAGTAIERAQLIRDLEDQFLGAIRSLVVSLEVRDKYTRGHSERVTAYALAMAEVLALPSSDRDVLELAGLLHDVGKIGVPEPILNKPDRLTDDEFRVIQDHPAQGERIVQHVRHPATQAVCDAIRHHHERFDGRGYPDRLAGPDTSRVARILSVADTWDAMTSDRSYRKAFPAETALRILRENAGTQLDPEMVECFAEAWSRGWIAEASVLGGPAARNRYLSRPSNMGDFLSTVRVR